MFLLLIVYLIFCSFGVIKAQDSGVTQVSSVNGFRALDLEFPTQIAIVLSICTTLIVGYTFRGPFGRFRTPVGEPSAPLSYCLIVVIMIFLLVAQLGVIVWYGLDISTKPPKIKLQKVRFGKGTTVTLLPPDIDLGFELDLQINNTNSVGVEIQNLKVSGSSSEVFLTEVTESKILVSSHSSNLFTVPAFVELTGQQLQLVVDALLDSCTCITFDIAGEMDLIIAGLGWSRFSISFKESVTVSLEDILSKEKKSQAPLEKPESPYPIDLLIIFITFVLSFIVYIYIWYGVYTKIQGEKALAKSESEKTKKLKLVKKSDKSSDADDDDGTPLIPGERCGSGTSSGRKGSKGSKGSSGRRRSSAGKDKRKNSKESRTVSKSPKRRRKSSTKNSPSRRRSTSSQASSGSGGLGGKRRKKSVKSKSPKGQRKKSNQLEQGPPGYNEGLLNLTVPDPALLSSSPTASRSPSQQRKGSNLLLGANFAKETKE